jgi:Na+/melibiose symporter-like transporter
MQQVSLKDKIGYGAGNLGVGVAMQVIGSYLIFFSTAILGIPGSLAGLVLGLSVFWDAVTDPLMGHLSDRTVSARLGRRHPYLVIGATGIIATVYLIWNIDPHLGSTTKFLLVCLYVMLFKTCMTIYVTPYTALGAELSTDYNERTQIQGIKTIFFLIGLAFVSAAGMYLFFQPSPDYPIGQLNPQSYRNAGLAAALLVLISAVVGFATTRKYIPRLNERIQLTSALEDEARPGSMQQLLQAVRNTYGNVAFRSAALSYLFNNMASALISTIGLHVYTYTFHFGNQEIALIFAVQFLFSILSQPLWAATSKRIDKRPALNLGLLLCATGSLLFAILVLARSHVMDNIWAFMPFAILTGLGTGALFTMPLSMVSDTIDLDELKTGFRSEGFYFGTLTLYYKASQALTIFLIGVLLDLIHFDVNQTAQSTFTLISLGMILAMGTLASFFLSWLSLRPYPIKEAMIAEVQAEILSRKQHHP